jgi:hypothetical protein
VLSGGLCGSALACCFGGGVTATADCLGLDVTDFVFGTGGSTGASLCTTGGTSLCGTGGWSSLFDLNRLCMKLPMLPESPVEAGVPSEVHPESAIAAATKVAVTKRMHRRLQASPDSAIAPSMMEPKASPKLGWDRGERRAIYNFKFNGK